MGNISGNINLTGFNKAFTQKFKDENGNDVECAVIPLPHNYLRKTDKGNVFVNFFGNEIPTEKRKEDRKDTHIVNLDPGKENRQKLKDLGEYPPTLGNLVDWDQNTPGESAPAQNAQDAGFQAPTDSENVPF